MEEHVLHYKNNAREATFGVEASSLANAQKQLADLLATVYPDKTLTVEKA
jgi:hypothetical protein